MTHRIEHRSTSRWAPQQVYDALINHQYLTDRLEVLGGTRTELVEHATTSDGAHFQLRQGVPTERLPTIAKSVISGDLVIDRSETWRSPEGGGHMGEVAAAIPGVPGKITGSMWLREIAGRGSEFVVDGEVQITIPFLGGKLEAVVADEVRRLLAAESEFTEEWISKNGTTDG